MAITNASRLADYASGIGTQGATLTINANDQRVGVGTTNPQGTLQVGTGVTIYGNSGIVSATSFYGDGANLTNTGSTLSDASGTQRVVLTSQTSGTMTASATDTALTYDASTDTLNASSFSGNFSGNLTGNATGLSGTPDVNVNNITGVAATFTGNVSIAGTLTYEDVTNVDSVGLVTARTGVKVTTGGVDITAGGLNVTAGGLNVTAGVSTFFGEQRITTGAEKVSRTSGNTVSLTYNSSSSSNVGYTTNPSGDVTLNVFGIPTSSDFDDYSISFAVIVRSTGTARTCTAVNLNGVSKTIRWGGGSLAASVSGVTTTSGHTVFSFTGINTVGSASTTANYEVFGTVSGGFY